MTGGEGEGIWSNGFENKSSHDRLSFYNSSDFDNACKLIFMVIRGVVR